MNSTTIAQRRLIAQHITQAAATPAEVVQSLGAIQAQDYLGALWALGLRTPGATEQQVEAAIAAKQIVRTWPMRGTIHFVAPADVRWMLDLLTPRVMRGTQSRLRGLEIDAALLARCADILEQALAGGQQLTRPAIYELFASHGIAATGSRGLHILGQLSMRGLLCFGARDGKQPTFTLLDEWVPATAALPTDEALARLALRYFTGHGPATAQDLMWWAGLTLSEAKAALAEVAPQLASAMFDGQHYYFAPALADITVDAHEIFLLPPFDEFLLGYRDRRAMLEPAHMNLVAPGSNGIFNPIVVIGGRVVGTWKREFKQRGVVTTWVPFDTFDATQNDAIAAAAKRYGAFLGLPVRLP